MQKYKIPIDYIESSILVDNEEKILDYTYDNSSLNEIIDKFKLNKDENFKKIKLNELFIFSKKKVEKESLLVENELSIKFKNILNNWFEIFTEGTGSMDKTYCANFISSVTKTDYVSESDLRVKKIFKWRNK